MGQPVRIYDIAQQLIHMSGREDIEIEITGLRPGEKLHEDLVGVDEHGVHRGHPQISHTESTMLDPENLDRHEWKLRGNMPTTEEIPVVSPPDGSGGPSVVLNKGHEATDDQERRDKSA